MFTIMILEEQVAVIDIVVLLLTVSSILMNLIIIFEWITNIKKTGYSAISLVFGHTVFTNLMFGIAAAILEAVMLNLMAKSTLTKLVDISISAWVVSFQLQAILMVLLTSVSDYFGVRYDNNFSKATGIVFLCLIWIASFGTNLGTCCGYLMIPVAIMLTISIHLEVRNTGK